jgi:hypothetical protein
MGPESFTYGHCSTRLRIPAYAYNETVRMLREPMRFDPKPGSHASYNAPRAGTALWSSRILALCELDKSTTIRMVGV